MAAKLEIAARIEKAWGFPKAKTAPAGDLITQFKNLEQQRNAIADAYDAFVDSFLAHFAKATGKEATPIHPANGPALKVGTNLIQDLKHLDQLFPGKSEEIFGRKISAQEFHDILQMVVLSL